MKWKDKTKRYDNPEIVSSEVYLGRFRLTVHRHIRYPPDTWLASCTNLPFTQVEMDSKLLEEAKKQAIAKVKTLLEDGLRDITSLMQDTNR